MESFKFVLIWSLIGGQVVADKRLLMDEDLQTQVQELSQRLARVEACLQQNGVAFTAVMGNHQTNISLHETLTYDQLPTNEGKAFNPSTGLFTAPYSGIYVFDLTIGYYDLIDVNIVKNGVILRRVYGHTTSNWEMATGSVTTHLDVNDHVYAVVAMYDAHGLLGHGLTSFSGYLVHPDCKN